MKAIQKSLSLLFYFVLMAHLTLNAQGDIHHSAFKAGEKLAYRIYFQSLLTGKLSAGKAELAVKKTVKFNDENVVSIVAKGHTKGFIKLFYKVNDRFQSYYDLTQERPVAFVKDVEEGSYQKYDSVLFNYEKSKAFGSYDTTHIVGNLTDVVSAIYHVRNLDFDGLDIGKTYEIPIFIDDNILHAEIKFIGYKFIKTKNKIYRCMGFVPSVNTKSYFKDENLGKIWLSDDVKRLPVLVESELKLGFIKLELLEASGLN